MKKYSYKFDNLHEKNSWDTSSPQLTQKEINKSVQWLMPVTVATWEDHSSASLNKKK
jgi:hypothetical protein